MSRTTSRICPVSNILTPRPRLFFVFEKILASRLIACRVTFGEEKRSLSVERVSLFAQTNETQCCHCRVTYYRLLLKNDNTTNYSLVN